MVQDTQVIGKIIKLTVMVNSGMLTGISMKGAGKMTKRMVREFMYIRMAPNMRVHGRMIYRMAMVQKHGLIKASSKVAIRME